MDLVRHALPVIFGLAAAAAAHAAQPPRISTPLERLATPVAGTVTPLRLDAGLYAQLRQSADAVIAGFPLGAEQVDLEVSRFDVFAPGAQVVGGSAAGDVPLPRPDVVLLRGKVAGVADSSVYLGLSPYGSNGLIRLGDRQFVIASRPAAEGLPTIVYDLASLPPDALPPSDFVCGTELLAGPHVALPPAGAVPTGAGCGQAALIAFDADWEFTDKFGGDIAAAEAYVTLLAGAVAEIYQGDVGVSMQISYLRVWSNPADPWTQDGALNQLEEFRTYWQANMLGVPRQTAHFLTARQLEGAGGVAYLPGLCQGSFAYGLSAYLNCSFPYPLEDHHPENWDVIVVAHELGHNFGAPHTHSMTPPVDACAFNQCANADQGTIMSYCHTCPGGVSNIILHFHERTINEGILPYLQFELPCQLGSAGVQITAQPSSHSVCPGDPVSFTVIANGPPPLTYQWRKDQVPISGAMGTTFSIAAAAPTDAGAYDVEVSSPCGAVTSDAAQLTMQSGCPGSCPWDCGGGPGIVGVTDFLALLGQWGQAGTSCDFNGGGVATTDFLALLSHWGICP